ncbi:fungal-specific transcription factor domain-containing protein [Mycena vitilis]|nr:fungal-specific transcription factor domain-containing protein [Mycena vitilis]
MPAAPKSPQSKKPGAPKQKGAVRAKSGCYTCRIRRKKCDEHQDQDGRCETCVRLRLQCLGFGAKRPDWLRENRNVTEMRDKIKAYLAAQGMIKGHSGSGPRGSEQAPDFLRLDEDTTTPSSSESPPTPTLSLSPNDGPRALPHESAMREQRWLGMEFSPMQNHHMRGASPLEGPSHSSHPDMPLYSTQYNPNSIAWIPPPNPVERYPAIASSFSATYHTNYDDYGYALEDEIPMDAVALASGGDALTYYLPMKQAGQIDELVTHYLRDVMVLQYLLSDTNQIHSILFPTVTTPGAAQDAAQLLAAIHKKHSTYRSHSLVALQDEELKYRYNELMQVLQKPHRNEDDALAAIHTISSVLFDGGRGPWQDWLAVSYEYAHSIFVDRDPRDTLQNCGETTRFIIKTAIWFDVLAAATTQEAPRFLRYIRELFSPEVSAVYDPTLPPSPELSMLSVMGCENHIVWALAEASALAVWKKQQQKRGCLSIPELVSRADNLDKLYLVPSTPPLYPGGQTDTELARDLSSNIFRAATRVYVRSIVSGDFPHVPEIVEAIDETMAYVRKSAEHSQKVYSSVVRSTVFAFFICGALTSRRDLQQEVIAALCLKGEDASLSTVGNIAPIRKLLEKIWRDRENKSQYAAVPWRETLREANMLLV